MARRGERAAGAARDTGGGSDHPLDTEAEATILSVAVVCGAKNLSAAVGLAFSGGWRRAVEVRLWMADDGETA